MLSLRVAVEAGEVRTRAELDGDVLCERAVPVPYGADELWDSLSLPASEAEAKLHGFGRRLSRCLLDEAALRTLLRVVGAAEPGDGLEVVITAEGAGLRLPYEAMRLPDDRVLALVPSVRFSRRVGVPRAVPYVAPAEQVRVLDVVGPAQLASGLAAAAYDVVRIFGARSAADAPADERQRLAWAVGRALRPPTVVVLGRCVDPTTGDADLAETLIGHGVGHVVAMQARPSASYGFGLAEALLRGLAVDGLAPSTALAVARAELPGPEYALPVLYSADSMDG
jgi:hypothetical protein